MKKTFKRVVSVLLAAVLSVGICSQLTVKAQADNKDLTGYTATELCAMMNKGFNIGNTFDATGGNLNDIYSQERSWGNPAVNKELIHGIKAAGFDIIRLPITWQLHILNDGKFTIDPKWLARIKEVVDMAMEEDLFIILNVHHDDTWLNIKTLTTDYKQVGKELSAVWKQIADYFADYDQRVIFESMNEPRAKGTDYEWSGSEAGSEAINYLNQVFVDAVRGNGKGHNPERALMTPGYAASSGHENLMRIKMPEWKGKQAENIIVAIHCYSPYNFCLSDAQNTFDPNNNGDTGDIKRLFKDIKTLFTDNGIPVIMGECGATRTQDNVAEREKWFDFFGKISKEYGVPAIVWDNGVNNKTGGENHSYIDRKTGEVVYPRLVTAFINGIDKKSLPVDDSFYDFEPKKVGDTTVVTTPRDAGFVTSLMGEARVNHTPDAKVGYSVKVDSGVEDATAYLDISKYAGRKLKISAFIYSESGDVSIGSLADDKSKEYVTGTPDGRWLGYGMGITAPDADKVLLYFKGTPGVKFNIDDISIEVVDSLEGITFDFPEEPKVNGDADVTQESTTSTTVESSDYESKDLDKPNVTIEEKNNKVTALPFIITAVVVAVGIIVARVVIVAKKKKEK